MTKFQCFDFCASYVHNPAEYDLKAYLLFINTILNDTLNLSYRMIQTYAKTRVSTRVSHFPELKLELDFEARVLTLLKRASKP